MILCKDIDALLHVISLVDWPKHVKSFFTLACSYMDTHNQYLMLMPVLQAGNFEVKHK